MKYALIIGNDDYDDPKLADLKTPKADSKALANVLSDEKMGAFDQVTPVLNQSGEKIRRAISAFLTQKKPDDLVMVYFSGHGVLDSHGRLYLAAKDTQASLLTATGVPAAFVTDELDNCRSKRQVLILDCCHSGAFERGAKGEQKAVTEATFEGTGFGRVVLTASDSTQVALEGDQVIPQTDMSLFTHFLFQGIATGEADLNSDGLITLDEWYDYAYTRVITQAPNQVPNKWSYRQQGDLVIARNPHAIKKAPELPLALIQALESSIASVREGGVRELGRILAGHDAGMAGLARAKLEEIQKSDDSRIVSAAAGKVLGETAGEEEKRNAQAEAGKASKPKEERVEIPPMKAGGKPPGNWFSNKRNLLVGGGGILLLIAAGIVIKLLVPAEPPAKPDDSDTPSDTVTLPPVITDEPTITDTPSATFTNSLTPTFTNTLRPTKIVDLPGGDMMLVPAGYFKMGESAERAQAECERVTSPDGCRPNVDFAFTDEAPMHTVYLEDFYIDRTEVTNSMYNLCIQKAVCGASGGGIVNNPVVNITWTDAASYCDMIGERLPTEAEWEKAARGTDGRTFPWGNAAPSGTLARYNPYTPTNFLGPLKPAPLADVNSFPDGASPYGVLNLAGNAWEWTADWFSADYYSKSPKANPQGPTIGTFRVMRGGSFVNPESYLRVSLRGSREPDKKSTSLGFRCVKDP